MPRTSKCVLEDVLEAKDVLKDSTSVNSIGVAQGHFCLVIHYLLSLIIIIQQNSTIHWLRQGTVKSKLSLFVCCFFLIWLLQIKIVHNNKSVMR